MHRQTQLDARKCVKIVTHDSTRLDSRSETSRAERPFGGKRVAQTWISMCFWQGKHIYEKLILIINDFYFLILSSPLLYFSNNRETTVIYLEIFVISSAISLASPIRFDWYLFVDKSMGEVGRSYLTSRSLALIYLLSAFKYLAIISWILKIPRTSI